MDQSEIKRRMPVWCALSDLFLDTELQAYGHRHTAEIIAQSGYSTKEAETILRNEVAPVFHLNLWSVAGEWTSWAEKDVEQMVVDRLDNPVWWQQISWLRELILNRYMATVRKDWREVKKLISEF